MMQEAKDSRNSRPARSRRSGQQANSAEATIDSAGVFAPSEPKKMKVEMKVSADTPSAFTVRTIYEDKGLVGIMSDPSWSNVDIEDEDSDLPECLSHHNIMGVILDNDDVYDHKYRWALMLDAADAADSLINQFVVSENVHNACFASGTCDVDRKLRRMLDVEMPNMRDARNAPMATLIESISRAAYAAEVTTLNMMEATHSRYDEWKSYDITTFELTEETQHNEPNKQLNHRIATLMHTVDQRVQLLALEGLISHYTYADLHAAITIFIDRLYVGNLATEQENNVLYSFAVARAAMRLVRNVMVITDLKLIEVMPVPEAVREMARRPMSEVL